jgi:hypothetical protein
MKNYKRKNKDNDRRNSIHETLNNRKAKEEDSWM